MKTLKVIFLGENGKKHTFTTKKFSERSDPKAIYQVIREFFDQEKAKGNPYFDQLLSVKICTRKEERILQCYRSKSGFNYVAEGEKKQPRKI